MTDNAITLNTYGIREGYTARVDPAYFHDTLNDGAFWQCDVYQLATALCFQITRHLKDDELLDISILMDVGCGAGSKVFAPSGYVGIDYGANIMLAKRNQDINGVWVTHNLENGLPIFSDDLPFGKVSSRVVVCADVIEHLINPAPLLQDLAALTHTAGAVVISTPDRLRLYSYDQNGEPANPHHAREWTLNELTVYLRSLGANIRLTGYTRANDKRTDKTTMILAGGAADIDFKAIAEQCGIEVTEYAF